MSQRYVVANIPVEAIGRTSMTTAEKLTMLHRDAQVAALVWRGMLDGDARVICPGSQAWLSKPVLKRARRLLT